MKKYETVMHWVRSGIEAGRISPGEKLPSEPELMRQFSVSRNAVRQAISELSNEGFVQSRHGIGTFCVRRVSGKTRMVGLVCMRLASYIFPRIIHGCNRVIQREGYSLLIHESWYDLNVERALLEGLRDKRVDGIIITPVEGRGGETNADLLAEMEQEGVSIVLLDNEYEGHDFTSVVLDDEEAGAKAASYLWQKGHRNIGILYSENYRPKVLRRDGAMRFLEEMGRPVRPEWLIGIEGQTSPRRTYGQIRSLFRSELRLPSAMVCSSDDEALMFMYQARRHGIGVPDDLSVISFDNSDLARFSHPRLTSMNHPSEYMGELAATLLLNSIYRRDAPARTRTVIASSVIRRESVRPRASVEEPA